MIALPARADWEAAGYRSYPDSFRLRPMGYCDAFMQKRVTDADGTRYFINVYLWNWGDRTSISCELQMREEATDVAVNFERSVKTTTEAEEFAARCWEFVGKSYYEKTT